MTRLEETLVRIADFLRKKNIPYMIIGGVANIFWGVSRSTLDVDVTIAVEESETSEFIDSIQKQFRSRVTNPVDFVAKMKVLPLEDANAVRLDVIFAKLPYEMRAIQRARPQKVEGTLVQVCSPEDLVIHKIVSDRLRDQEDVRGIIERQGAGLDRAYLDPLVRELSRALDKPGLWDFYDSCFKRR